MLAIAFFQDPLTLFVVGLFLVALFFWYFATEDDTRKRNVGSVLILGVVALSILSITPPKERLKGGIDIVGGSSFTLQVQPRVAEDGTVREVTPNDVDQAIRVIEKRVNSMGTSEPLIARQGNDGILVQMPGVDPDTSKRVRTTLEKVAHLELREVCPRNEEAGADGKRLCQRVAEGLEIVPGYKSFTMRAKDGAPQSSILLNRRPALTGKNISQAHPSPQRFDAVAITLDSDGGDKMNALTKNMTEGKDRIAIVLDNEVISAPVVQKVPLGRDFEITGLSEAGEAVSLSNSLMNPLENPLKVTEERTVSPTLGAAVVQQGILSGIIGLSLTFIFVLIYYRVAGFVALIGLLLNGVILFGIMAMFGFTFSLPGIAGIILTIGVAVDANVLINERLREELASGKSLGVAIAAAYDKAFSAILDSNVVSLITAVILFWKATSTVKGFAVTLTIGILASLFSAILGTRVLFRWGVDLKVLKKLSFLHLIRSQGYDFLGKRVVCGLVSLALVIVSISTFAYRGQTSLGIDFTGGKLIQFQLGKDKHISTEDVQKVLDGVKLSKMAYPQDEKNPYTGTLLTIRCATSDAPLIESKLRASLPLLGEKAKDAKGVEHYVIDASVQEVSALIGNSFLKDSVIALCLGLVGIILYVTLRFEFSFAVGAFIAVIHDVVIAAGMVVLFGGQLSLIHVGAILTIAGYSINDTIIIFDRIRENLRFRRGDTEHIMNEAINATLSRTILTSTATLMSVLALAVLGGSGLKDFSVMILIGIIVGTYSSILVASPIVLWWITWNKKDLSGQTLDRNLEVEVTGAG